MYCCGGEDVDGGDEGVLIVFFCVLMVDVFEGEDGVSDVDEDVEWVDEEYE